MPNLGKQIEINKGAKIPDFLKNCFFFFDKDLSTVTDAGTFTVNDLSLIKNNLIQATTANKPTFSTTNGLTFSTSAKTLNFEDTLPISARYFTMYFRLNRGSSSLNQNIIYGNDEIKFYTGDFANNPFNILIKDTLFTFSTLTLSLSSGDTIGNHLWKIIGNGTTFSVYIDNVLKGTISNSLRSRCFLRGIGNFGASGELHQFAIYNKPLNILEQSLVEAQLTNKTIILPRYRMPVRPLYALNGQSNALGQNDISTYPSVYQNYSQYKMLDYNPSNADLVDIGTPLTINEGPFIAATTRGLEMSLLKGLKETDGQNGFLFKCTQGSSAMADTSSANHYTWALSPAVIGYGMMPGFNWGYSYITKKIKSIGFTPILKANIRFQAEADSQVLDQANAFSVNLSNWKNYVITNVYKKVVPFIEVRIYPYAPTTVYKYVDIIRPVQASQQYWGNVDDLTLFDGVHLDLNSCITLGNRIKDTIVANKINL